MRPEFRPDLNSETAARVLKLRVVLARQGAFRLQSGNDAFGALCILPGIEDVVRLFRGFGGKQLARMHYPDGRVQGAVMDSGTAAGFAALIHACDSRIWAGRNSARTIPTEIRRLVNWAAASDEPSVASAVERLWDAGSTLDLSFTGRDWVPSAQICQFVRACSLSLDGRVRMSAEALLAVIRREAVSAPYDEREAMRDTDRFVSRWAADAWVSRPEELAAPSGVWVRLKTHNAVEADALALGRRKEEFLDARMPLRLSPVQDAMRLVAPARTPDGALSKPSKRAANDAVEVWSLRDRFGRPLTMACIALGELIACGRDGRDLDALSAHVMDFALLRGARLTPDQAAGT